MKKHILIFLTFFVWMLLLSLVLQRIAGSSKYLNIIILGLFALLAPLIIHYVEATKTKLIFRYIPILMLTIASALIGIGLRDFSMEWLDNIVSFFNIEFTPNSINYSIFNVFIVSLIFIIFYSTMSYGRSIKKK